MGFSAFSRFNGGFRFSSRVPHGRRIYEALKTSQGDTYDESFDGRQSARLYAAAMSLAAAQYQIDRALNNASPITATELLGKHENDYQIVPGYQQTLHERRVVADARRKVTRGARREAVEDALRTLLGDDFVSYEVNEIADTVTWPATPGNVGTFKRAGAPKKGFRLAGAIASISAARTVAIEAIPGLDLPQANETYTLDPDSRSPNTEKITVTAATSSSITATFTKPHPSGTVAVSPHPVWISNRRQDRIVTTFAAANNPETRRKINEVMARMLRGVSQWSVVSDEGSFLLGDATRARLDCTVLT
jgi:hypothetical protein